MECSASSGRIKVLLDTDIGGDIDDTWALALALRCPEIDLRLVVADTADTVYRAKIAAKLLEVAGRTDVPVGIGLPFQSDGPRERQKAWVEDYDLRRYPGRVHADGVGALIDAILSSPTTPTLVAIGPAPNLAEALRREPRIAERADFVGMFGSLAFNHDGQPGAIAEWNVVKDIAAAQAVFSAPWRSFTLTPLDTCGRIRLDGARYAAVRDSRDPLLAAVIGNYRLYAQCVSRVADVETRSSLLYDTVAVTLAFTRAHLHMERLRLRVTDDGFTVPDARARPMDVAVEWTDLPAYLDFLVARLTGAAA